MVGCSKFTNSYDYNLVLNCLMQINDSFLATAAAAIIVIIIIRYCDMMWLVLLGTYCNVFCKVLYTYMIWNYREVQIEG